MNGGAGQRLALTARDIELLAYLAMHGGAPLDHVAAKFFAKNPFSGAVNKNPLAACERRVAALAADGYLMRRRINDGKVPRTLVVPQARALAVVGARRKRIPNRKVGHHACALDAVALLERSVAKRGGRVLDVSMEQAVRSQAQSGRMVRRGDSFPCFPDAVCTIEVPDGAGMRTLRVAVEYATSKYCDKDIVEKHESFQQYDRVFWFCDRPRTRERVMNLTGAPCSILS